MDNVHFMAQTVLSAVNVFMTITFRRLFSLRFCISFSHLKMLSRLDLHIRDEEEKSRRLHYYLFFFLRKIQERSCRLNTQL